MLPLGAQLFLRHHRITRAEHRVVRLVHTESCQRELGLWLPAKRTGLLGEDLRRRLHKRRAWEPTPGSQLEPKLCLCGKWTGCHGRERRHGDEFDWSTGLRDGPASIDFCLGEQNYTDDEQRHADKDFVKLAIKLEEQHTYGEGRSVDFEGWPVAPRRSIVHPFVCLVLVMASI